MGLNIKFKLIYSLFGPFDILTSQNNLHESTWASLFFGSVDTMILIPLSKRPSSIVISSQKFQYAWNYSGPFCTCLDHLACKMSLSKWKWSSCAVASHSNWILLVVACSLQVISWIWTIGSLLLLCNGPRFDKQSVSQLGEPLIYLTLKSYGRVPICKCWSLGVVCIRLLASTF